MTDVTNPQETAEDKQETAQQKKKGKYSRLTPAQWKRIGTMWELGEVTIQELSKKYGPAPEHISRKFKELGFKHNARAGEYGQKIKKEVDKRIEDDAKKWADRIRDTKEEGVTRLFYRWEGKDLTDTHWQPLGIAMRGDPNYGERRGGMQAPYVIRQKDQFLMYYGDWVSICLATSRDGKSFERASINGGGPQLFTEGDGNNARDAMLLDIGGVWHCYYSAMPKESGAIFVRRSTDLRDWSQSEPIRVVFHGSPGKLWYHAECPHVVPYMGYYYLFRTSNYYGKPLTTVYRSLDPTSFGIDDDSKIVTTLPVAAPEVIHYRGRMYLAALNPRLDGIRITTLDFAAED